MDNALEILISYRAWVSRESNEMPDPVQIGLAIDEAIVRENDSVEGGLLARFNDWRRDDSETPLGRLSMPDPAKVAATIDYVIKKWGE